MLGIFGMIKNPMRMTPEERVLDAYYDRLQVYPVEKSRVIRHRLSVGGPELAAEVANAIAEAYLVRQQAAKQQQARAAGEWLAGEIESMRQKVADAEAKVEAFPLQLQSPGRPQQYDALRAVSLAMSTRSLPPRARKRRTRSPRPS